MIGNSAAMRILRDLVRKVAPTNCNVLILGESGTGKELVARSVHDHSPRAKQPFVPVNCGAIPCDLLESELFGHEKGSFTGALTRRRGRFEYAEGGTLFLDEVGDMPLQMQVKLLRVLEERSYERVGSNQPIHCNVRIVAATHRDLNAAITEGRFREDLYYRLNVFPVEVAPLRERLSDLPMLIEYFAARQAESGGSRLRLAPDAVDSLARCPWVGNVRELANLIERLSILHPRHIVRAEDLPAAYRIAAPRNGGLAAVPTLNAPQNDGGVERALRAPHGNVAERATLRAPQNGVTEAPTFKAPQNDGMAEAPIFKPAQKAGVAEAPTFKALQNDGGAEDLIVDDLPFAGLDLKSHLARIEACFIRQALQASHGKVAEAARLLHLRRTTLVEKIRKGADNYLRYMIFS